MRAVTARHSERAQADALRSTIDELKAGQALMIDMHARRAAAAQQEPGRRRSGLRRYAGPRSSGRRGGLWRGSGPRGGGSENRREAGAL